MTADATTFVIGFTAVFGGIAFYLLRLDRLARALERRLAAVEREGRSALDSGKPSAGPGGPPNR